VVLDSEHGDDSFLGEADLGDEGFDGGLTFGGGAGVEDVVQVGAELLDGVRASQLAERNPGRIVGISSI
jgi:hypothetical protein